MEQLKRVTEHLQQIEIPIGEETQWQGEYLIFVIGDKDKCRNFPPLTSLPVQKIGHALDTEDPFDPTITVQGEDPETLNALINTSIGKLRNQYKKGEKAGNLSPPAPLNQQSLIFVTSSGIIPADREKTEKAIKTWRELVPSEYPIHIVLPDPGKINDLEGFLNILRPYASRVTLLEGKPEIWTMLNALDPEILLKRETVLNSAFQAFGMSDQEHEKGTLVEIQRMIPIDLERLVRDLKEEFLKEMSGKSPKALRETIDDLTAKLSDFDLGISRKQERLKILEEKQKKKRQRKAINKMKKSIEEYNSKDNLLAGLPVSVRDIYYQLHKQSRLQFHDDDSHSDEYHLGKFENYKEEVRWVAEYLWMESGLEKKSKLPLLARKKREKRKELLEGTLTKIAQKLIQTNKTGYSGQEKVYPRDRIEALYKALKDLQPELENEEEKMMRLIFDIFEMKIESFKERKQNTEEDEKREQRERRIQQLKEELISQKKGKRQLTERLNGVRSQEENVLALSEEIPRLDEDKKIEIITSFLKKSSELREIIEDIKNKYAGTEIGMAVEPLVIMFINKKIIPLVFDPNSEDTPKLDALAKQIFQGGRFNGTVTILNLPPQTTGKDVPGFFGFAIHEQKLTFTPREDEVFGKRAFRQKLKETKNMENLQKNFKEEET